MLACARSFGEVDRRFGTMPIWMDAKFEVVNPLLGWEMLSRDEKDLNFFHEYPFQNLIL